MADDIDRAQEREQITREEALAKAAKPLPKGNPGVCYECGYWSARLVLGVCAPCRDSLGIR
jgi:hypothetical protein